LYAATGSTLQLLGDNPNGTGTLNVILGQSGNFDAAGTISVSSAISDGGSNFALTKTGAGALTLSGANTFGGGVTLSTGTLNINNAAALGTGAFTISGGVIDNTSGADITTSTNNNAQAWNGDFTPAPRV
jgi:autotransporter-associated beta strand protein